MSLSRDSSIGLSLFQVIFTPASPLNCQMTLFLVRNQFLRFVFFFFRFTQWGVQKLTVWCSESTKKSVKNDYFWCWIIFIIFVLLKLLLLWISATFTSFEYHASWQGACHCTPPENWDEYLTWTNRLLLHGPLSLLFFIK